MSRPRYLAGGSIDVNRFVKIDSSNDFTVLEVSASTDKIVGVSQDGSRLPPLEGYVSDASAATSGQNIRVYGPGEECLVKAGGTITRGDLVTGTTDGKAITDPATGTVFIGGFALESGVDGELIRIFVWPFKIKYS